MIKSEEKIISLILFLFFFLFYVFQIPCTTFNGDVLTFVSRSLENSPMIDFAYLGSGTLINGEALPNYHLGHTIFFWIIYQLIPEYLEASIFPAGLISALFSALSIVLTFMIWNKLGINKRASILIAVSFGFVPSFWEHAIIGEIHAMQMFFTLLFAYSFIKDRLLISSFSLLIANLVTPMSALAFGLVLLKGFNKSTMKNAIYVGSIALTAFIVIFLLIDSNLFELFNSVEHPTKERGILYRLSVLIFFILINFNLLFFYIIKGFKKSFNNEKKHFLNLIIATIPQVCLIFVSAKFFIELGSFQLPLFWALAFPLGISLASIKLKSFYFITSATVSVGITVYIWIVPHFSVGNSLSEAGKWLRINNYSSNSVIGPWDESVSILFNRNGSNYNHLNRYYNDEAEPCDNDLIKTQKDELIIIKQKKNQLRRFISSLEIPGLILNEYNPENKIKIGITKKIFENNVVALYKWEK